MKRIIPIALTLVFVMPYFINSFAYGDTVITKWTSKGTTNDKNVGKTDPVTFDFDETGNTISIGFNKEAEKVEVSIYKDGILIYNDKDKAESETMVSYEITNAEQGDYTVTVTTDGEPQVDETVTIE